MISMKDVYMAEQRFEEMRREAEQRCVIRRMMADTAPASPFARARQWFAGMGERFRRSADEERQRRPVAGAMSPQA
jgi:hypothetical protein